MVLSNLPGLVSAGSRSSFLLVAIQKEDEIREDYIQSTCKDHDVGVGAEPIHFDEHLIKGAVSFIVSTKSS